MADAKKKIAKIRKLKDIEVKLYTYMRQVFLNQMFFLQILKGKQTLLEKMIESSKTNNNNNNNKNNEIALKNYEEKEQKFENLLNFLICIQVLYSFLTGSINNCLGIKEKNIKKMI